MASEEDLLDDTSYKEYGDLEDLDADAEEALLGIGSDDELQVNEGYEDTGEEVEYVDEDGNPVEIAEGDEVEYIEYTDSGHDTETYDAGDSIAEDVLDLVVDADLEFDDSAIQEEPQEKKPRLPVSARFEQAVQNSVLPLGEAEEERERVEDHVEADEQQSENAGPDDDEDETREEIANSASESEDEDEDEEDEGSGRGRFHSERPNIIQLSAAKKRTNIPDTLDGIYQINDSFRPDSFRDKRSRMNWEHSRQDQQQQLRNRDYRAREEKERGPWPVHGNKSTSQPVHNTSRLDPPLFSKNSHNNQSKETSSSAPSVSSSQPSLLGDPPNLLSRPAPPRDPKESQGPRKILINPHFKGSITASSSSSSSTSRGSSWSESHPSTGRVAPLLDVPPSFHQAHLGNFTSAVIHHQPSLVEVPTLLMAEQRHQQQQQPSYHQFNMTQHSPQRPSHNVAHYSELPVSGYQHHDSRVGPPPYSSSNAVSGTPVSAPPPQYPPMDVCGQPPLHQQLHHPNDPWHQNVPPPPTHVQPEVQHVGAWNNPPPPMPQYAAAPVSNAVPQSWPPPQQQAIQSTYNPSMEQHRHPHAHHQLQPQPHQLPAVSLPDMRLPPPNYNVPRMTPPQTSAAVPWQGQMQRPKHHLHGAPLSVPRFNHPPPPLLTNVPSNPRFIVSATSPLKQLTPRMPFNTKNNANNLRPRLPNVVYMRGLLPQQAQLWPPPRSTVGQNVRAQLFNRKRPLNQTVGLSGKVMKASSAHHQVISRRQFQVISNIKEVQLVDTLPPPTPLPPAAAPVVRKASPAKIPPKTDPKSEIKVDDEDEETRRYRQQIELQKKKREEILRIKEQRRQLMALQRRKQLVEQQKLEANIGSDVNGLKNFQPMVSQKGVNTISMVNPSSVPTGSQQSPLLVRTTGQPIMSLVSKKQIVVRRVPPLGVGNITSPTFVVQQPGFFQHISQPRPPARLPQTRNPNYVSQSGLRQTLMQRVVPVKQIMAQFSKGVDLKTSVPNATLSTVTTSNVKLMSQQLQQQSVAGSPRRVMKSASGVAQPSPVSPNIVSKKFPVQAVNAEQKKNIQQLKQKQQQMAMMKQNVGQRAVIAGHQAKRTVIMNSADVKLVQQKQQPVAAVVGQQTQRRVLTVKNARVQIDNLALSTSEAEVHKLCQNVGPVEDVVLHRERRTAVVTFRNQQHAHEFMNKYQRRMLDLSLMNISMLT